MKLCVVAGARGGCICVLFCGACLLQLHPEAFQACFIASPSGAVVCVTVKLVLLHDVVCIGKGASAGRSREVFLPLPAGRHVLCRSVVLFSFFVVYPFVLCILSYDTNID